jgi:hypothetical protein
MKKNSLTPLILLVSLFIVSCSSSDKEKKDTSDLYAKSQTRGEIIDRSGTLFRAGSNQKDIQRQMDDANNRLMSGGGLFGKKGGISILGLGGNDSGVQTSMGMPINPYLWKGSLETVDFMPLISADPFAGIILTDWYSSGDSLGERCKVNIFIKGVDLKSQNLKVNSFCQKLNPDNIWIDQPIVADNNIQLENAIFNKAKKYRLAIN